MSAPEKKKKTFIPTRDQVSSGGVAYRINDSITEVVLISVGPQGRWQLPKGIVEQSEPPEQTAVREVREETGIQTELIGHIDSIEYWYVGGSGEHRVRFHKCVHFYLLAFREGDVNDHDHEVEEARWVPIDEAISLLAFKNEKTIVERARTLIASRERSQA